MQEKVQQLARELLDAAVKLEAAEQAGTATMALASEVNSKRQALQEAKCNTQS